MKTAIGPELQAELVKIIKDRARLDFYIDRDEEREILQFALQKGLTLEQGVEILHKVSKDGAFMLESDLLNETLERLRGIYHEESCITERAFCKLLSELGAKTAKYQPGKDWRETLVSMIEENGFRTRPGWFKDWFLQVKKDLGIA